jgi:hypothetical protein
VGQKITNPAPETNQSSLNTTATTGAKTQASLAIVARPPADHNPKRDAPRAKLNTTIQSTGQTNKQGQHLSSKPKTKWPAQSGLSCVSELPLRTTQCSCNAAQSPSGRLNQSKADDFMRLPIFLACIVLTAGSCLAGNDVDRRHGGGSSPLVEQRYDPCTDGRISDGRPRSCAELRRALRHDRWRDWRDEEYSRARRPFINPCTDGRFSDGRPRSCRELLDWLDSQ